MLFRSLDQLGIGTDQAIKALVPLMRSTLNNLERLGLPNALTGPVSRGDASAVRAHLGEIGSRAPVELGPYIILARRALAVAYAQAKASPENLRQVGLELGRFEDFPGAAISEST